MNKKDIRKYGLKFDRFIGCLFVLAGGVIMYFSIPLLLDPESTIRYKGEMTFDVTVKMFVFLFGVFFLLLGLFFSMVPKSVHERIFFKNNKLFNLFTKNDKNT